MHIVVLAPYFGLQQEPVRFGVTLQPIVVLIMLITLPDVEVIAGLCMQCRTTGTDRADRQRFKGYYCKDPEGISIVQIIDYLEL